MEFNRNRLKPTTVPTREFMMKKSVMYSDRQLIKDYKRWGHDGLDCSSIWWILDFWKFWSDSFYGIIVGLEVSGTDSISFLCGGISY
jgi:hypothetical protein